MEEYKRNCPECGKILSYCGKRELNNAINKNSLCSSCYKRGKKNTEKSKRKVSKKMSGKNNPMYGKTFYDVWLEKYGKREANKRLENFKNKMSRRTKGENNPLYKKSNYYFWEKKYGKKEADKRQERFIKKCSINNKGQNNSHYGKTNYDIWLVKYGKEEADKREKESNEKNAKSNRLRREKEIKEKHGQIIPNYNPIACEIIRWFNMYYDLKLQHAENGGEICIDGYWPDGCDQKRKLIAEVDESYHFDTEGNIRQKDIDRQKYLENKGYEVIRITL